MIIDHCYWGNLIINSKQLQLFPFQFLVVRNGVNFHKPSDCSFSGDCFGSEGNSFSCISICASATIKITN